MKRGKLIEWYDKKGYGLIRVSGVSHRIFVHIGDISSKRRPIVGDSISFQEEKDENGKMKAVNAKINEPIGVLFIALLSLPFICSFVVIHLSIFPLLIYFSMGFITYMFYFQDKHMARMGGDRLPEKWIHLLEFLGGWPGALLAQRIIRHKNKKPSYQIVFRGIILVHLFIWGVCFMAACMG